MFIYILAETRDMFFKRNIECTCTRTHANVHFVFVMGCFNVLRFFFFYFFFVFLNRSNTSNDIKMIYRVYTRLHIDKIQLSQLLSCRLLLTFLFDKLGMSFFRTKTERFFSLFFVEKCAIAATRNKWNKY